MFNVFDNVEDDNLDLYQNVSESSIKNVSLRHGFVLDIFQHHDELFE